MRAREHIRFSAVAATALLALALGTPAPRAQDSAAAEVQQSRIVGKIVRPDGSGVAGATVMAYHLSSEQLFSSAETAGNGEFAVLGLPYGYFDLAVDAADGLYVGNQVVNVPPSGKISLVFTIRPFTEGVDQQGRDFPGLNEPSAGIAQVRTKATTREFWRGPKGIAIIGGVGGAALLLAASGDGESEPSPFLPP